MSYAIFNSYCLECGASDEKTYVLAHEGKLVHQCTLCGSNSIMWQVDEITEDDEEPKVNQGKEMVVNDEEDFEDGPSHLRCGRCGAEDGYSRVWMLDVNEFVIQCAVCGVVLAKGSRPTPAEMLESA